MSEIAPTTFNDSNGALAAAPWNAPRLSGHSVQFYEEDSYLLNEVGRYVGAALGSGDSAIVIATPPHRDGLMNRLGDQGIDWRLATQQGRFLSLDAGECLAHFMVAGEPDPTLFRNAIGALIDQVSRLGNRVAAFGEMVALLWESGNQRAALLLEQLWNELARTHSFQLHCAYPMHLFADIQDQRAIAQVCAEHSHIVPTEGYTAQPTENDRLRTILELQQKARALETEVRRRQELQEAVESREAELRDYVENGLIGMHWVSSTGEILWANDAELRMLGYDRSEYIGRHIADFHADQSVIDDIMRRLSRREELHGYEARLRRKDGSIREVRIHSNVYTRSGRFIHTRCFTVDVTELKQAQKDQAHLAAIVECSEDAIFSTDLNGTILSWNRSAERMLGYRSDEILGKPVSTIIPPELMADEHRMIARIRNGESIEHLETVRFPKTGDPLHIALTVSPIRDASGTVIGVAKTLRDITQKKRLMEALHTSDRLAAVGRLAATIAHEINNPLESVTNLIYLVQAHPGTPAATKEYLTVAEKELRRAADIAQQTLGFQRSPSYPSRVNLAETLGTVLALYERRFVSKNLRVDTRLDPALSIVTWAGEFKQILSNLISNAFDACRHGGVVTIRMRLTQIRPTSSPALRFTVADNGVGIPREHQAAIFEPFFTTKEFVGTGLGLWVTKSLIDKRGGKLQVRSRNTSPSGTVMSFCFPVELPDVEPQRLH